MSCVRAQEFSQILPSAVTGKSFVIRRSRQGLETRLVIANRSCLLPGSLVRSCISPGSLCLHTESGGYSFGSRRAIWNNKGDCGLHLRCERQASVRMVLLVAHLPVG